MCEAGSKGAGRRVGRGRYSGGAQATHPRLQRHVVKGGQAGLAAGAGRAAAGGGGRAGGGLGAQQAALAAEQPLAVQAVGLHRHHPLAGWPALRGALRGDRQALLPGAQLLAGGEIELHGEVRWQHPGPWHSALAFLRSW